MDIEEVKKYSQNKIEADNLIRQIRQRIKETTWEKQNLREGFTETFKPLISQFEKPDDPKAQNIFTQNQKMLQNQLALTEGIRANQKAITDGFSQFERLADMQELPGVEAIEDGEDDKDDQARAPLPKEDKAPIVKLDLEKNLDENDLATIKGYNFRRPNDFYGSSIEDLEKILKKLTEGIQTLTSSINGRKRKKFPNEEYLATTLSMEEEKKSLKKYKNTIQDYFKSLEYKVGQGLYFSPQELLHRFELLKGSLAAGNNGVLPELIKILHRLRDLGIVSNKQLNTFLRKLSEHNINE